MLGNFVVKSWVCITFNIQDADSELSIIKDCERLITDTGEDVLTKISENAIMEDGKNTLTKESEIALTDDSYSEQSKDGEDNYDKHLI
jgi:hypothetical protein